MKNNNILVNHQTKKKEISKQTNPGLLKSRDNEFDTAKSFLIISMIVAHSIQRFWLSHYDRNLTYYVTFGFIFLAGLTLGSTSYDKLSSNRVQLSWQVFSRGLKLFIIFLFTNMLLIVISPYLLHQFLTSTPYEVLFSLISGEREIGTISFSFVILLPISLTFMFGPSLLIWKNRILDWFLIVTCYIVLWVIEITGILDYFAAKLMIVGCISILLAKLLVTVNWLALRATLSKWLLPIIICYLIYQGVLVVFNPEAALLAHHYIIVTALLLLIVYLAAYRLELSSLKIVEYSNKFLSRYMLFAYLFHIMLQVIVVKFLNRGNFYFAFAIGIITIIVTALAGLLIDNLTKRYKTFNKLYAFVFK